MTVTFLIGFGLGAAGLFDPKYLQDVHGWSPPGVSGLLLVGGLLIIVAGPLAGRWGDRYGRRPTTVAFLVGWPLLVLAFYNRAGFLLQFAWVGMIFLQVAAGVSIVAYGAELFPTRIALPPRASGPWQ